MAMHAIAAKWVATSVDTVALAAAHNTDSTTVEGKTSVWGVLVSVDNSTAAAVAAGETTTATTATAATAATATATATTATEEEETEETEETAAAAAAAVEVASADLTRLGLASVVETLSALAMALLAVVAGGVVGVLGAPLYKIKSTVAAVLLAGGAALPLARRSHTSLVLDAMSLAVVDTRGGILSLAPPSPPLALSSPLPSSVSLLPLSSPSKVWIRWMGDAALALTGIGWLANWSLIAITHRSFMDFVLGTRIVPGAYIHVDLAPQSTATRAAL